MSDALAFAMLLLRPYISGRLAILSKNQEPIYEMRIGLTLDNHMSFQDADVV
jgi:hypothetical protein